MDKLTGDLIEDCPTYLSTVLPLLPSLLLGVEVLVVVAVACVWCECVVL